MEDQPDFVRAPDVAAPHEDPDEAAITARRIPCICPEQHRGACGRTLSYSTARGRLEERVGCDRCDRTWKRITA